MTKEKLARLLELSSDVYHCPLSQEEIAEYHTLKAEFEAWNPSKNMAGHRILLNQRDEARGVARTLFRLFQGELDSENWLEQSPWLKEENS